MIRLRRPEKFALTYRKRMAEMAALVSDGLSLDRESAVEARFAEAFVLLRTLDRWAPQAAARYVKEQFLKSERATRLFLRDTGLRRVFDGAANAFRDDQMEEALWLLSLGFRRTNQQLVSQLEFLRREARFLRSRQRLIGETVARVGALAQATPKTLARGLLSEVGAKRDVLKWRDVGREAGGVFRTLAELGRIETPGGRKMRVDRYIEQLVRTQVAQARTNAQRSELLRANYPLVRVSLNEPLHPDMCSLYIGKVFALTEEASKTFGVPHVAQLPNGGPPFHPNCRHFEIPFFPDMEPLEDLNHLAIEPPPRWALTADARDVERRVRALIRGQSEKQAIETMAKYNAAANKYRYAVDTPEGLRERKRKIVGKFRTARKISERPTPVGQGFSFDVLPQQ